MPSLKTTYSRLSAQGNLKPVWQATLDDYVQALTFSPDSQQLAAASVSGPIALYDTVSGRLSHKLSGHNFGTTSLAWHSSGAIFASAGQDGIIRLWHAKSGAEKRVLAGGAAWVEHLTWQPEGDLLLSAAGRKLRLWNKSGDLVREYAEHGSRGIGKVGTF